jgi:hypothetical protein
MAEQRKPNSSMMFRYYQVADGPLIVMANNQVINPHYPGEGGMRLEERMWENPNSQRHYLAREGNNVPETDFFPVRSRVILYEQKETLDEETRFVRKKDLGEIIDKGIIQYEPFVAARKAYRQAEEEYRQHLGQLEEVSQQNKIRWGSTCEEMKKRIVAMPKFREFSKSEFLRYRQRARLSEDYVVGLVSGESFFLLSDGGELLDPDNKLTAGGWRFYLNGFRKGIVPLRAGTEVMFQAKEGGSAGMVVVSELTFPRAITSVELLPKSFFENALRKYTSVRSRMAETVKNLNGAKDGVPFMEDFFMYLKQGPAPQFEDFARRYLRSVVRG